MLIIFQSKAASEVLMLAEHAQYLLKAAHKANGDEIAERGVFAVEQLDKAIDGIEAAVHTASLSSSGQEDKANEEDDAEDLNLLPSISLGQRAYPLLELLKKAKSAGQSVTWEQQIPW